VGGVCWLWLCVVGGWLTSRQNFPIFEAKMSTMEEQLEYDRAADGTHVIKQALNMGWNGNQERIIVRFPTDESNVDEYVLVAVRKPIGSNVTIIIQ
jgi:hypothetical protein